ncbi:hypothetical protein J6590_027828, partial [Homalodisca vitripennis]
LFRLAIDQSFVECEQQRIISDPIAYTAPNPRRILRLVDDQQFAKFVQRCCIRKFSSRT